MLDSENIHKVPMQRDVLLYEKMRVETLLLL